MSIVSLSASKFPDDYHAHIKGMMKELGIGDEHREDVIRDFWYPLDPDQAKIKFREAFDSGISFSDFLVKLNEARTPTY